MPALIRSSRSRPGAWRHRVTVALAAFVWVWATTVQAEGLYLRGQLGGSFLSDADFEGGEQIGLNEADFDPGFALGGAIGYKTRGNLRIEGEVSHRRNGLDTLGPALADGDVTATSFLANAFYDFENLFRGITPYIGGGLGYSLVSIDDARVGTVGRIVADDEDTAFTGQLGAGLAYRLTPQTQVTADYRYLRTLEPEFEDSQGDSFDAKYRNHAFLVGLQYELPSR